MCPLTPSSHANHARFSACWLSYETPREHGAAARLRDGRGNKDSVAVNSTSPRALNIFLCRASSIRWSPARSSVAPFCFFFFSSIRLVFGEITVASCSLRLPHFLRHTTEPPPACFHSLLGFAFFAFCFPGLDTGRKTLQIIFLPRVLRCRRRQVSFTDPHLFCLYLSLDKISVSAHTVCGALMANGKIHRKGLNYV